MGGQSGSWTPTKRRGPIAAEFQGPGPAALTLPSLFGSKYPLHTTFVQFEKSRILNFSRPFLSHRSRGKSRNVIKMQGKTEGTMKISASRALKRAPT